MRCEGWGGVGWWAGFGWLCWWGVAGRYAGSCLGQAVLEAQRHRYAQAAYPDPTRATSWGPYLALLPVGFAVPACCQARGAPLPHHFNLDTHVLRRRSDVSFSCTFRRSDERRVGKESACPRSSRWSPYY